LHFIEIIEKNWKFPPFITHVPPITWKRTKK
jgi:hypothetical protein